MADLRDIINSDRFACGGALVTTRGPIDEAKAVRTRTFARELIAAPRIDWMSIAAHRTNPPEFVDR